MRELKKTKPLDKCASGCRARGSGETNFVGFGVIGCEPKGVSYPRPNRRAVESSVSILTLLYEHNEMSPLMLLLIMKALFRKKHK